MQFKRNAIEHLKYYDNNASFRELTNVGIK